MAMKLEFLSRIRQQREESGSQPSEEKPAEKRNILLERLLKKKAAGEEHEESSSDMAEALPQEESVKKTEEDISVTDSEENDDAYGQTKACEDIDNEEIIETVDPEDALEEVSDSKEDMEPLDLVEDATFMETEETEETGTSNDVAPEAPKEKPKRGRKKKTEEKAAESVSMGDFGEINVIGQKMTLGEAELLVRESFETEEWITVKNRLSESFSRIHPAADMTPAVLRFEMQAIMDLMAEIAIPLAETKGLLDALNDENHGLCVAIRRLAGAEGANEQARTACGYSALKCYNWNGREVNLLSLVAALKLKFNFLSSLDRRLQLMAGMCNTVCGTLKIEENLQ